MKWLGKIIAALVLLCVICVLALTGFVMLMDLNKLKPMIENAVSEKTGYQLQMDGQLSWSFFPRLAIKAERMTLQGPQQSKPFIDLRGVKMATEWLPLLRGQEKLEGHLSIADVKFMNLHAQNLQVSLAAQESVFMLKTIKASLYGGSLTANAQGRDFDKKPRWVWEAQLDNVQLKPLLLDLNGPNSKLEIAGLAKQVTFNGQALGFTKDQILSSLNGSTTFKVENGIVEGIDINYFVQTADALINKQTIAAPANLNQTAFNSLTGSALIKNGIAETNDLLLTSPAFVTKGKGNINLINQAAHIQLLIKAQQTLKTQWEIPLLVSGDITRPQVTLDMQEIEKTIAKEEIEKVKTKASEIINKHIPGKAGEYLQNLLGQ